MSFQKQITLHMSESGTDKQEQNPPVARDPDAMLVDVLGGIDSLPQNGSNTNGISLTENNGGPSPVRDDAIAALLSTDPIANGGSELTNGTGTAPTSSAQANGAPNKSPIPPQAQEGQFQGQQQAPQTHSQSPHPQQVPEQGQAQPQVQEHQPQSESQHTRTVAADEVPKDKEARLLILYDKPKYKPIKRQVEQFLELGPTDTLEISDFAGFLGSDIERKQYKYMNISIEYNDEFESNLRKVQEFVTEHKDFVSKVEKIGYHIHFNGDKKWSEYTEFEKAEYAKFLETLSSYKSKVYHVSIINKYEIDTIYLTEKNDLTKLGEDIQNDFKNWENLETFDYSDNCIRFLPGVIFPDSLQVMNISGSYCIETLNGFKMPSSLKTLIAGHNSINSIDNLKLPSKLEVLNLTDNKIYFLNYSEFPETLKYLNLANNRIDNIRGIEFPKGLETLSLAFNPIDNIKGAKFPEKLKYLDISCIPNESMTGLKFPDSLVTLNLQESMANTRGLKLPNFLKNLNLGNDGVNSINPLKLPNTLETLYLGHNNIKTLNKVNFPPHLTKLFLGNNLITTLKNVTFPNNLEVLDIEMDPDLEENDKRISNLKDVVFPPSLKVLKLGYQGIKVLENFEFPVALQELDLSFNDLKLMKNIKFHNNLKKLDISGNQELIEIDQFILPDSVKELRIPSQLIPNLPGYIIERANSKDLVITKSLPF